MSHWKTTRDNAFAISSTITGTALALVFLVAGCSAPPKQQPGNWPPPDKASTNAAMKAASMASDKLREGDVIKLTFAGAPNLNTALSIRRDGKISPPLIAEVMAAGLTPSELETNLLELYGPQLVVKDVKVSVESSTFQVYVTGAVIHQGKVVSVRPLTPFEAIMEAGGPDYARANLKGVTVMRTENGRMQTYKIDLKKAMKGQATEVFKLEPGDVIVVPEKFSWL